MPLAPGPFGQLSDDAVKIEPGEYDFTDDAQGLSGTLNTLYDSMTDGLAGLSDFAADSLSDLEDGALDSAIAALGVADVMAGFPSIDTAVQAYDVGDVQLTAAVSFAPDQAWVNPPAAFVPPEDAPTVVVPIVPVDAFNPGSYVPGSSTPNPNGPWVQLLNQTRVGQINFAVGDRWQIIGLGKPGQQVTATATRNGQQLGQTSYGQLDSDGKFLLEGVMPPENVGAWFEAWSFDGAPVASFNFVVVAANVPS